MVSAGPVGGLGVSSVDCALEHSLGSVQQANLQGWQVPLLICLAAGSGCHPGCLRSPSSDFVPLGRCPSFLVWWPQDRVHSEPRWTLKTL